MFGLHSVQFGCVFCINNLWNTGVEDIHMNKAILVAGLAWGDEGKGAAVNYLCREYGAKLIVRYNGGCQCAHNVVLKDGMHHIFAQFGSGTLIPEVRTFLSRFMMINPVSMLHEAEVLKNTGIDDPFNSLTVSDKCLVVTPFDKAMNVIREKVNKHGSCGVGIGETRYYHNTYANDALFDGDLRDKTICSLKLKLKRLRIHDEAERLYKQSLTGNLYFPSFIDDLVEQYYSWSYTVFVHNWLLKTLIEWNGKPESVIFEGAQGILLDERDEFLPHNTWSNTTFENADTLLKETKFDGEVTRIGCIRSYMTRHGVGPFPPAVKKLSKCTELHNKDYE